MEIMEYLGFLIQCACAVFVNLFIGFTWYSEVAFGRVWWAYTFPGIAFGDMKSIKKSGTLNIMPLHLTFVTVIIQSMILTFSINTLLPMFAEHSSVCTGLRFPVIFGAIVAGVLACASIPHYVFAMKPLGLLLICIGHDTAQLFASVFAIYMLA